MPSPAAEPFDQSGVRAAYDTVASTYAAMLPDTRAEAPLDLAMVDAFITAVRGDGQAGAERAGDGSPVLDAGCGTGRMSRYLADRGCAVRGIDLSPRMVAEARRAQPDLPFAVASLTGLPFDADAFDGVQPVLAAAAAASRGCCRAGRWPGAARRWSGTWDDPRASSRHNEGARYRGSSKGSSPQSPRRHTDLRVRCGGPPDLNRWRTRLSTSTRTHFRTCLVEGTSRTRSPRPGG